MGFGSDFNVVGLCGIRWVWAEFVYANGAQYGTTERKGVVGFCMDLLALSRVRAPKSVSDVLVMVHFMF